MANHPSALKRHRQSLARRKRNQSARARTRTLVRNLNEAIGSGDKAAAQEKLRIASVTLAKAASKGLLHRRTASRRTSRLARKVSALPS